MQLLFLGNVWNLLQFPLTHWRKIKVSSNVFFLRIIISRTNIMWVFFSQKLYLEFSNLQQKS